MRWDSLGEFLALAVSLEHLSDDPGNRRAKILADALDKATEKLLETNKSPSPKVREMDNRGSQFYLAIVLGAGHGRADEGSGTAVAFRATRPDLKENETKIMQEMNAVQGRPVDIGGYYAPIPELASKAMRPSETFNAALAGFR